MAPSSGKVYEHSYAIYFPVRCLSVHSLAVSLRPVGMVVSIGRDMGLSLLSRHGHSQ